MNTEDSYMIQADYTITDDQEFQNMITNEIDYCIQDLTNLSEDLSKDLNKMENIIEEISKIETSSNNEISRNKKETLLHNKKAAAILAQTATLAKCTILSMRVTNMTLQIGLAEKSRKTDN